MVPSVAQGRLYELDGLRGWAAVSVMLSHFLFGVFVKADPQVLTPLTKEFLEPLLGGTLDVAVFFVVSGEALSAPYWAKPSRKTVVRLAAKRYLRLTIPILASCLIVFALGKFGLLFHRQAASLLHVEDWLGTFLQKDFGVADLLGYAAVGVFCCHTQETSLNPFLGTMQAELLGSVLVFGYLLLDRSIRPKSIILLIAVVICLGFDSFLSVPMLHGRFTNRLRRARSGSMRMIERISISSADRERLKGLVRKGTRPRRWFGERGSLLLASDGQAAEAVAAVVGKRPSDGAPLARRYVAKGVDGLLKDATRPSRVKPLSPEKIKQVVHMTLHEKPPKATHWSGRSMAAATGISYNGVQRIWRAHG